MCNRAPIAAILYVSKETGRGRLISSCLQKSIHHAKSFIDTKCLAAGVSCHCTIVAAVGLCFVPFRYIQGFSLLCLTVLVGFGTSTETAAHIQFKVLPFPKNCRSSKYRKLSLVVRLSFLSTTTRV